MKFLCSLAFRFFPFFSFVKFNNNINVFGDLDVQRFVKLFQIAITKQLTMIDIKNSYILKE